MSTSSTGPAVLFTIGHSNHSEQQFVDLLQRHQIEVLADVRSQPYSRYNPQFNDRNLKATLDGAGIRYLFMGDQLGGRPEGDEFFDEAGHVLYGRLAESPQFLEGIDRLREGSQRYRVAIMCSEEDPTVCHRFLLVTRVICQRGVQVQHIRGDGRLESEETLRPRQQQGMLFQDMEQDSWKSIRSVLSKPQPPNSLEN